MGRRLRIGVDARTLRQTRTGVERMAYHFFSHLEDAGAEFEYVLFVDGPLPEDAAHLAAKHEIVVSALRNRAAQRLFDVWLTWQLRSLLKEHRIDAFFSPNTKFPFAALPRFTVIHGLEWHFYPQGYKRIERLKQRVWFELCMRYSAGIITFASNTLQDVQTLHPGSAVPIQVVPEGVDRRFRVLRPEERDSAVIRDLGIKGPYILSVSSLEKRKNLDTLLAAYALMASRNDVAEELVLVGMPKWGSEKLNRMASRLGIAARVRLTGFVSDEQLVQLYNQASVFVYPSRYEGFGLPLLEAMACGVPVVTSNCSSLPEVAGDAAVLIDPCSKEDLARGALLVLQDGGLRETLAAKGLERATHYSWAAMTSRICAFIGETVRA